MLRGSDVIGLPIVIPNDNVEERVISWIFDLAANRILAFLVRQGGWHGGAQVLLWENVGILRQGSLLTDRQPPIIAIDKVMQVKQVLESPSTLVGTEVVTREGDLLGTIEDFYFDEESGVMVGFTLTDQPGENARSAGEVTFYPVFEPLVSASGMVVATPAMMSAVQETCAPAEEILRDTDPESQVLALRGCRARYDVRNAAGLIVAAAGQIITDDVVARVRRHRVEAALLRAVGLIT